MSRPHQIGPIAIEASDEPAEQVDAMDADWTQTHVYGRRFWDNTFSGLCRRLSIETLTTGLVVFDRFDAPRLPDLLRFLDIGPSAYYTVAVTVATAPLVDGFLTCLTFRRSRSLAQPATLAEIAAAFVADELRAEPTIEARMRAVHHAISPPRDPDPVLRQVDYPAFDSGTLGMGFGLLIDDAGTVRLWSRVLHYHK
jgi:hypothetical protein